MSDIGARSGARSKSEPVSGEGPTSAAVGNARAPLELAWSPGVYASHGWILFFLLLDAPGLAFVWFLTQGITQSRTAHR
eukprot:scaffold30513_cov123-Isochrysis_galbana.AAC.3